MHVQLPDTKSNLSQVTTQEFGGGGGGGVFTNLNGSFKVGYNQL